MSTPISSRFILGTTVSEATSARLLAQVPNAAPDTIVQLCVFEVTVDGDKVVYACWSGGDIVNGEILMTPVGQAACEALANLPMGSNKELIICQTKVGKTPVAEKVLANLRAAPPGAKLYFLGELSGELDGVLSPIFNYADNPPLLIGEAANLDQGA